MSILTTPEELTEVDELIKELIKPTNAIILWNDDHNSFDHVIRCLQKYCKQGSEQAEQCAMIVHSNGKCDIKHGSYKELKPICEALTDNGLSATIE